jgi:hypothetical protein
MAEGDLAMLVLRTADHLRHIKALHQVLRAPWRPPPQRPLTLILRDPVMPDRPAPISTEEQQD